MIGPHNYVIMLIQIKFTLSASSGVRKPNDWRRLILRSECEAVCGPTITYNRIRDGQ
jgi:hypothetical protein